MLRAAANSIASGKPSSRVQMVAMSAALVSVITKLGRTARERCTNRATASFASNWGRGGRRLGLGSASGETGNSCSAVMRNPARLVASTLRSGHEAMRVAISGAAAATCSRLSSTKRMSCSPRLTARCSQSGRSPSSRTPRARAMAASTRAGSRTGERSTKATPVANSGANVSATRRARRVFPTPPGPVSVTKRRSP